MLPFQALSWMKGPLQWEQSVGKQPPKSHSVLVCGGDGTDQQEASGLMGFMGFASFSAGLECNS